MTIVEKRACYGCGACNAICAVNAITMQADADGFLYPVIDDAVCVNCGRCKQVCPALQHTEKAYRETGYAVKLKDEAVRANSTSGGAFSALATLVLDQGGAVYGAAYDDAMAVIHARIDSQDDLHRLRGSKYVQSDTDGAFAAVCEDLKAGRAVLFSGTPCQVEGLSLYLAARKVDTEKLLTCELLCHGAPSPLIWAEHIAHIEKVRGKKVVAYHARSKVKGWHEHNEMIVFENGKRESQSKLSQNCKDLFYGNLTIRPSCEQCPYAGHPGAADFTIGDCWGIEYTLPSFDDNKGCSLIIPNTEKAESVWETVSPVFEAAELPIDKQLKYNHYKPITPHPKRAQFWQDFHAHGFAFVTAKYAMDTPKGRLIYGAKKRLRRLLVKLHILNP